MFTTNPSVAHVLAVDGDPTVRKTIAENLRDGDIHATPQAEQLARELDVRLEERVGERARIARELHDTLLQSFHGLLLRFQSVYELLPARPDEAKETLAGAIDEAAEAIAEGRLGVQGLRSSLVESNDLAVAVKTFGEELAADQAGDDSVALRMVVEGTPRDIHPILRDEICRIAREALLNAFRHAQAKQIEVELHYDDRKLRLRVRDDGKGIDPKFLTEEGREGHYGLPGMCERAKLIGGKLTVWSALNSGTELELSVPAVRAHAASSRLRRSWLARKPSAKRARTWREAVATWVRRQLRTPHHGPDSRFSRLHPAQLTRSQDRDVSKKVQSRDDFVLSPLKEDEHRSATDCYLNHRPLINSYQSSGRARASLSLIEHARSASPVSVVTDSIKSARKP